MREKSGRIEKDSMGEMTVPADALHGASTHRAVLNFPVSGYRFSRPFIRALGLIKWAAAQANHDLGLLDSERAALIVQAAEEVSEGKLDEHFPLDIFQTGSGTSTNTNANEVIANRSAQLAGKPIGSHDPVHPNDHVNMGQSSNDVIPSAIHISAAELLKNDLVPALENGGVLPQFVGDLVNDELASLRKSVVRFSQQRAFLLDLKNAERDAGENVITRSEPVAFQLEWQRCRITMDHVNTPIGCKLAF